MLIDSLMLKTKIKITLDLTSHTFSPIVLISVKTIKLRKAEFKYTNFNKKQHLRKIVVEKV